MEDEMYSMPSTTKYSEKALMTPESIFPTEYHGFLMSSSSRIPMFGSDELLPPPWPSPSLAELNPLRIIFFAFSF
ncbi:hypothetical protein VIGAN_10212000 [Vigna angularis var. angularis]|uniref:Uncharacterized protein n=1 Tax=Vigna angularis var. angularis TaxID=157739 RepID=A0A0S3T6J2_PHAAN|nr:hypothetical protein VIGAN_10212000 [Vigna angularis var. angularis]